MTELLVLRDLNPLRKGFKLDPDDLERRSKKKIKSNVPYSGKQEARKKEKQL